METFIHKYLTRHYELSTTKESSKKLSIIVCYGIYYRNDSKVKTEVYNSDLLKELVTIFSVNETKVKCFVNNWAKSKNKNVSLKAYWNKLASLLPIAIKIASSTISFDLVPVQPMGEPTGQLVMVDEPNINGRILQREGVGEIIQELINNQNNYMINELDAPMAIGHLIGVSSRAKKDSE